MCHQSIFSFIKCHHTAQALTICSEGTFAPLRPCLENLDGDFIQFDAVCKGCQAVFLLQGEKDGRRMPTDVKGIHDTMPFGYVVGGQLPWSQPWYDAKKPPKATLVVCSERDSWRIWEESLVSLVLSTRDSEEDDDDDATTATIPDSPCLQDALTPWSSSSPSAMETPASPSVTCKRQKRMCCDFSQQRGCSPPWLPPEAPPTCEAKHKSSIKRTEERPLSPAAAAADQQIPSRPRSKPRVRFLPNAEVQYFVEDTATYLIKRGDVTMTRDTRFVT